MFFCCSFLFLFLLQMYMSVCLCAYLICLSVCPPRPSHEWSFTKRLNGYANHFFVEHIWDRNGPTGPPRLTIVPGGLNGFVGPVRCEHEGWERGGGGVSPGCLCCIGVDLFDDSSTLVPTLKTAIRFLWVLFITSSTPSPLPTFPVPGFLSSPLSNQHVWSKPSPSARSFSLPMPLVRLVILGVYRSLQWTKRKIHESVSHVCSRLWLVVAISTLWWWLSFCFLQHHRSLSWFWHCFKWWPICISKHMYMSVCACLLFISKYCEQTPWINSPRAQVSTPSTPPSHWPFAPKLDDLCRC